MDLFENEELLKPKKKIKIKASTVIMVIIVILVLLCFAILGAIAYLKDSMLTITLDNQEANNLKSILIMEEEKIYIPIRRMAEYLKYETYNGDYITLSEETNKCYIENMEELVSFTLDSNIITKVRGKETEQVKISEPVIQINGELCITAEGAEDAFNFQFMSNNERNKIEIETLSYLYTGYANYYITKGFVAIENEIFANKMAIFDNLLIVKATNGNYGVIVPTTGEVVLETKYESIEYLPQTMDFLVSSNKKKGIIAKDKSTKISVSYDSIEKFTNQNDIFYVVGNSNRYGLLDVNGNIVIYPEYSGIGMNVSEYTKNGVTNGYVFFDKIIPVSNNNKWALFNINGEKITDFIYDGFGCQSKTNNTYGVLQIKDYNLIVARQGAKYDLITQNGIGLFKNFILDSVYMSVTSGQTNYYITYGNNNIELFNFLEENGVKKETN